MRWRLSVDSSELTSDTACADSAIGCLRQPSCNDISIPTQITYPRMSRPYTKQRHRAELVRFIHSIGEGFQTLSWGNRWHSSYDGRSQLQALYTPMFMTAFHSEPPLWSEVGAIVNYWSCSRGNSCGRGDRFVTAGAMCLITGAEPLFLQAKDKMKLAIYGTTCDKSDVRVCHTH